MKVHGLKALTVREEVCAWSCNCGVVGYVYPSAGHPRTLKQRAKDAWRNHVTSCQAGACRMSK